MRWFIEVSRVGENNPTEKYCLEAKQWQAALQEARKLRGDAGPLSKFSIELLDDGYRAVDPTLKIRYIVAKAPHDAPISVPGNNNSGAHAEPAPRTEPMASPAPLAPPSRPEAAPKTDPMGAPPPSAPAPSKSAVATVRGEPAASAPEATKPVSAEPARAAQAAAAPAIAPTTHPTQRSLEVAKAPDFQLIRKREEEPTAQSPIAYREYAYAVKPGTDRQAAEVLLWIRFREIQGSLDERPSGKFVQLAVFDHVFERKPVRPPIATLAWKDWRGEPVLTFTEATSGGASGAPPRPSSAPPRPTSTAPSAPAVVKAASVPAPPAAPSVPAPPSGPIIEAAPTSEDLGIDVDVEAAPSSADAVPPWPTSQSPAAGAASAAPASTAPAAPASATPAAPASAAPVAPTTSAAPAAPASAPPSAKASAPTTQPSAVQAQARAHAKAQADAAERAAAEMPPPRRRKPGEDLIGELFEAMHDLHFVSDVVSGAQFVLGIAQQMLPSSGIIVHVFDINTRHFVVVRAAGPNAAKVLLHRTSDKEPLFVEAMRRTRTLRVDDASKDGRFAAGRWQTLGVEPTSVLFGPVQQGGRYLGVIELANPDGDTPYHEGESNALDYICEQFAEFVAARPIVVDADVVIGKG